MESPNIRRVAAVADTGVSEVPSPGVTLSYRIVILWKILISCKDEQSPEKIHLPAASMSSCQYQASIQTTKTNQMSAIHLSLSGHANPIERGASLPEDWVLERAIADSAVPKD
ncbi:MAG: hypothetical protein RIC16_13785 [Rhodospirillales bacterium]